MIYPTRSDGTTPPPQMFSTRTAEKSASRMAYHREFDPRNNRRSRREKMQIGSGERATPKMATDDPSVVKRPPNRRAANGHSSPGRRPHALVKG